MTFAGLLATVGVEERSVLRSRFGFLALHGGLEQATAELATEAAQRAGASLYAVVQPPDLRWHIPSNQMHPAASPALAGFLDHVEMVVSLHGYGGLRTPSTVGSASGSPPVASGPVSADDRWTTVLVGGANRVLAAELAADLRTALDHYTWLDDIDRIPGHLRGVHPDNPVNRPRLGGVQLELPPRARGYGRYWADFDGPGWPPHPAVVLDVLVSFARRKVERNTIKNLD
jgi:phage replication-related protein YjqB (UPF0714/DUF867 family)